jgi:hypothetical protein
VIPEQIIHKKVFDAYVSHLYFCFAPINMPISAHGSIVFSKKELSCSLMDEIDSGFLDENKQPTEMSQLFIKSVRVQAGIRCGFFMRSRRYPKAMAIS